MRQHTCPSDPQCQECALTAEIATWLQSEIEKENLIHSPDSPHGHFITSHQLHLLYRTTTPPPSTPLGQRTLSTYATNLMSFGPEYRRVRASGSMRIFPLLPSSSLFLPGQILHSSRESSPQRPGRASPPQRAPYRYRQSMGDTWCSPAVRKAATDAILRGETIESAQIIAGQLRAAENGEPATITPPRVSVTSVRRWLKAAGLPDPTTDPARSDAVARGHETREYLRAQEDRVERFYNPGHPRFATPPSSDKKKDAAAIMREWKCPHGQPKAIFCNVCHAQMLEMGLIPRT